MSTRKRPSWRSQAPSGRERTRMLKRCGKRCFLGSKKRFPICKKNTCKVMREGVQAAYIRARQFGHSAIARKAKRLLRERHR
jgi:hypothetical protein